MAARIQLTLKGRAAGHDVINTLWYEDVNEAQDGYTTEDLIAFLNAWYSAKAGAWLDIFATNYELVELIAQGWSSAWERIPFLPESRAGGEFGVYPGTPAPPMYCGILAFRVSPMTPPAGLSHMRRSYLAIGPLANTAFGGDGTLTTAFRTSTAATTFADTIRGGIAFTAGAVSSVTVFRRYGAPLPASTVRAGGIVSGATWRQEASARRSRKLGVGS